VVSLTLPVALAEFYLSARAILFGGEVAASLEHGLHVIDDSESRTSGRSMAPATPARRKR